MAAANNATDVPNSKVRVDYNGSTWYLSPYDLEVINREGGVDYVCRPCAVCGGPVAAGIGYLHQRCNERPLPQAIRERRRWDGMRNKVAPRILQRDGHQCRHCGSTDNLTVDHVAPIARGGSHEDDNLQTLCGSCNSRKGDR
jgi:5-methylcytosine-specific restriction endonuclease McrA